MATPAAIRPSLGAALHHVCGSTRRIAVTPSVVQTAAISTTASLLKRHKYPGARDNRDHSKHRGESAIRRTGTRWRLSVSDEPLPKPVPLKDLPPVETDPDHGLWEFFPDRVTVAAVPEEDAKHGRGWSVEELRKKSWDDLHRLWWVCCKERNRLATGEWERRKQKLGYGEAEAAKRDDEVKVTMRGIKHVLTERQYVWEDALKLAEDDPEINLSGDGNPVFAPSEFLEEVEELEETVEEMQREGFKEGAGETKQLSSNVAGSVDAAETTSTNSDQGAARLRQGV
ncbi:hypothetical protein OQA88_7771 [Cercophora sp. LCS_1]